MIGKCLSFVHDTSLVHGPLTVTQVRLPNTAVHIYGCDSSTALTSSLTLCGLSAESSALTDLELARELLASRLGGAGVDPVFLPSSSLYDPGLDPSEYYNISIGSGEINVNDYPWGFFSIALPGNLGLGLSMSLPGNNLGLHKSRLALYQNG